MKKFKEIIGEASKPTGMMKVSFDLNKVAEGLRKQLDLLKRDRNPAEAQVKRAIELLEGAAYDLAFPEK